MKDLELAAELDDARRRGRPVDTEEGRGREGRAARRVGWDGGPLGEEVVGWDLGRSAQGEEAGRAAAAAAAAEAEAVLVAAGATGKDVVVG